uniref:hypothetical protein n=1 Tax=Fluviicola sp. TaxID=1917219 RepID=UPI004048FD5B
MKRVLFLFVALLLVVDFSYGQGCSQCKLLAEQGSELDENSFGSSINSGILYLMAFPYLILLFFVQTSHHPILQRQKRSLI